MVIRVDFTDDFLDAVWIQSSEPFYAGINYSQQNIKIS